MKVHTALLTVFDKNGIVDFAKGLKGLGIEIITTHGTSRVLDKAGIETRSISDLTGYEEMLGGRVKSLHPKIFGGVLADRDNPAHLKQLRENSIEPIDLVAVNFYDLQGVSDDDEDGLLEKIDIGGPSLARAAAKNYRNVAIVPDPVFYDEIVAELDENDCELSKQTRRDLATSAFAMTSEYDKKIKSKIESLSV